MKNPTHLATLCLLALAVPATADTFVLKDGTRLEGTILSQTPESYVLEVQITKSIKDEKTVPKADVVKIERERADLKAFEEVAALVPVPDLTPAAEYDRRIRVASAFVKDHAISPKYPDAKKILATLQQESTAITAGGIKIQGNLIPAEEYKSNAYELDSRVEEKKIRQFAAKADVVGALKAYHSFEQDYASTAAAKDLKPLVRQVLISYNTQVTQLLESYDARRAERRKGLETMSGESRRNTEAALREELAQVHARFVAEKQTPRGWITPNEFHPETLKEAQRYATESLRALDSQQQDQPEGGKLYRDAWTALHTGDTPDANAVKDALKAVREAKTPQRYVTILEDAAKSAGIPL